MIQAAGTRAGQFCWVDLAATDSRAAQEFYGALFGWKAGEQAANGGHFTRLMLSGEDVGSMYQLSAVHRADGVPSHWTPYVRVASVDDAAQRAVALGAQILVRPFAVSGVARIALILDPVGAHFGLWEPLEQGEGRHD